MLIKHEQFQLDHMITFEFHIYDAIKIVTVWLLVECLNYSQGVGGKYEDDKNDKYVEGLDLSNLKNV